MTNGLGKRLPEPTQAPAFEGFRLQVKHGLSNPLRDFLALIVQRMQPQGAPELPEGLLAWIAAHEHSSAALTGAQALSAGGVDQYPQKTRVLPAGKSEKSGHPPTSPKYDQI